MAAALTPADIERRRREDEARAGVRDSLVGVWKALGAAEHGDAGPAVELMARTNDIDGRVSFLQCLQQVRRKAHPRLPAAQVSTGQHSRGDRVMGYQSPAARLKRVLGVSQAPCPDPEQADWQQASQVTTFRHRIAEFVAAS